MSHEAEFCSEVNRKDKWVQLAKRGQKLLIWFGILHPQAILAAQ